MNRLDLIQSYTDNAVYCGLFGFTLATANKHLALPPSATEEQRRDHMGVLALQSLATIERMLTVEIAKGNDLERTLATAKSIASGLGTYYRDRGVSGVALLTARDVMTARTP